MCFTPAHVCEELKAANDCPQLCKGDYTGTSFPSCIAILVSAVVGFVELPWLSVHSCVRSLTALRSSGLRKGKSHSVKYDRVHSNNQACTGPSSWRRMTGANAVGNATTRAMFVFLSLSVKTRLVVGSSLIASLIPVIVHVLAFWGSNHIPQRV